MEPEASSRSTRRSGLILRRRPCSRRTRRARITRARRTASAWARATSAGSTMWRMSTVARFSTPDAPSRRPRPSLDASASPSWRRSVLSGRPALPWDGAGSARRRGGAGPACGAPTRMRASRMWLPSQNASKISSKRSQSEWVAQKSARSAGLSDAARAPGGPARIASASRVSARPTLKPLSRKVRAKPASFCRAAAPISASAWPASAWLWLIAAALIALASRDLAEQAIADLAGEPRAVLVRLEEADHGLVHRLKLLAQVMNAEARERRGPVERLGDARHLAQILLAHRRHHAGDLQRESRIDAGHAGENDLRLAIDLGEIDIVIETAPAQRIGELARGVGGEHHARDRGCLDGAELRNADLEIGQELEQEGLEFLVGAVDLVDQQHRRLVAADRGEERALEQIALREDVLLDRVGVLADSLARLDGEQLALVIPLVEGGVLVEALVALQADQLGAVHARERLGDLGLADPGLALEQQRVLEEFHQPQRRGDVAVRHIAGGGEAVGDLVAVEGHGQRDNSSSLFSGGGGSTACAKRRRSGWGGHRRRFRCAAVTPTRRRCAPSTSPLQGEVKGASP